jgi:hypothetical protein
VHASTCAWAGEHRRVPEAAVLSATADDRAAVAPLDEALLVLPLPPQAAMKVPARPATTAAATR